jgi:hypothetical protein
LKPNPAINWRGVFFTIHAKGFIDECEGWIVSYKFDLVLFKK